MNENDGLSRYQYLKKRLSLYDGNYYYITNDMPSALLLSKIEPIQRRLNILGKFEDNINFAEEMDFSKEEYLKALKKLRDLGLLKTENGSDILDLQLLDSFSFKVKEKIFLGRLERFKKKNEDKFIGIFDKKRDLK